MLEPSKNYPPEMHTAEHILNQTMVRMFKCGRSFNSHIEKKKSKCDYHFDRAITEEEIGSIEEQVNQVIHSKVAVTEEFYSREEAKTKFNLSKLPEDSGELVRIIRIGDYDACPCIGQHVMNTESIGAFKINSASFENQILRIRFKL